MGALPEQKEPEHTTRTFDFSLTRTDQLFEDKKPGYYNFGVKVFERGCFLPGCDKKFKTHLKLLKYCSPKHYVDGLDLIINSITKEKKWHNSTQWLSRLERGW